MHGASAISINFPRVHCRYLTDRSSEELTDQGEVVGRQFLFRQCKLGEADRDVEFGGIAKLGDLCGRYFVEFVAHWAFALTNASCLSAGSQRAQALGAYCSTCISLRRS